MHIKILPCPVRTGEDAEDRRLRYVLERAAAS